MTFYYFLTLIFLFFSVLDSYATRQLVDQVCLITADKEAIFLSDVITLSKQKNITQKEAYNQLMEEAGLWFYAKNQLKFGDLKQINEAAKNHLKNFREKNQLTEKDVNQAPYFTSFSRLEKQFALGMLKNQLESHLYNKIKISDEQINKALADQFQLIFIEIQNDSDNLSKIITDQVLSKKSLSELRRIYAKNPKVSFSDPIDYKKGHLKDVYEKNLQKNFQAEITAPFKDGKHTFLIWKIKKVINIKGLDKTSLEDLKEEIIKEEIRRELLRISSLPNKEFVVVDNCVINP